MTTLPKENNVVTLINVFTVEPQNQQKLVEMLVEASEQTTKEDLRFSRMVNLVVRI